MTEKTCNAKIIRQNTKGTRLQRTSGMTKVVCTAGLATQCVTVYTFFFAYQSIVHDYGFADRYGSVRIEIDKVEIICNA